ncbi:MAG TPA: DNA polymerase III subunit delta [Vicinamibacterales bacterium]|jgi:DNA polymerase-3 subunit delta|nr:DNA polymerase III subunit delta [Vicinamibacterales bacterium]
MPTASAAAVRQQIEAGGLAPLYLLQGEDEVEKASLAHHLEEAIEEGLRAFNVERIHAAEWTTGDKVAAGVAGVIDALRTLPMMAPRRVVTVLQAEQLLAPRRESEAATQALEELQAYVEKPDPHATLVLVSAALDRRTKMFKLMAKCAVVVDCGAPDDLAGAVRWIRTRVEAAGQQIDPGAARTLASLAGFQDRPRENQSGDVKRLRNDVDRLLLYAMGQKAITLADVQELTGPAALQDDWAMTNAIEAADAGQALKQLALLIDAGAPSEKILGQLAWVVRAKFPIIAPDQVEPGVDAVFRTDLDLKRSAGDGRVLLERLVVELCAGRRARAKRW